VMHERQVELNSALDRLMDAGLLFRQGAQQHATHFFKHALLQDAAYNTLLREPRRTFHVRIAEALEGQFSGDRRERTGTYWRVTTQRPDRSRRQ
jgi:predicted ATPase